MRELNFQETGAGPSIVLLHPVGLAGGFWEKLPERLAQTRRVFAVDLAGHGDSPDSGRPGRMADNVADIIGLIERRDAGPAVILGASFGGMIAQQVALARPDLVAGLVLAACPGMIPDSGRAAILERGALAERDGMEAVVAPTLERWFTPSFRDDPAVDRVRARLLANDPSNWAAAWEAVSEHDALPRLGSLDVPALVVAGEADAATPLAAKRALADAIPGSRLVVLEDAPHMMQIECAARFGDAVAGFLAERCPA